MLHICSPRLLRTLVAVVGLGLLGTSGVALTVAQATVSTESLTLPFTSSFENPCTGEVIALTGDQQLLIHTTEDAAGGFHLQTQFRVNGVTGTGVTSGTPYRVVAESISSTNDSTTPQTEFTFVATTGVISMDQDDNFAVHQTMHVTVAATGEVTAVVLNTSTECRG